MPALERYSMPVEVCTVSYLRTSTAWGPQRTYGSLTSGRQVLASTDD